MLAKQLVEAVRRTGTLTKACEALDVDRTGVYEWILDPEFRDYWDQIQIVRHELDPVRAAFVEDAMIQRSIEGKATGTETIFYLINRLPHKYRNTKDVRVSGAVGVLGLIQQLPKEEAQRLLQLSAPEFEREIVRLYASAQARDDEPGD